MRSIVLSGPMGAGKTTLGPLVSARLGLPFIDTDAEIARDAGMPISDFWRTAGEAAFRQKEAALIERLLADDAPACVIAFGGGAVTDKRIRRRALDRALVVTLTASIETLLARTNGDGSRPLLAFGDPRERLTALLEGRDAAYRECHLSLSTDASELDLLVESVAALSRREPISVPLGARSYVIDICQAEPVRLTDAVARLAPSSILLVTDAHVQRLRGAEIAEALHPLVAPVIPVVLPPGEIHKTLSTVGAIWDAALGGQIDRDTVVVAVGGGVVGDLAGFAASTLLRGIRVVQVPTTLLAMVDASAGGKTAFDHPAGKNLIGTFHQPSAVVVDLDHLRTLAKRECTAGLAEVVKIACVADAPLFEQMEASADALARFEVTALLPVVQRAIELKAQIVRDDETEKGARALLNFGHTIGHALESHGGYSRYLHGEAVSLGMVAELVVGERLGLAVSGLKSRLSHLLTRLGLPTQPKPGEVRAAWPYVSMDKKRSRGSVAFPVIEALGRASVGRVRLSDMERICLGG